MRRRERPSFCNGTPRVIEHGFDLVHRDLVRVVAQAYRLRRNVGADTLHSGQLAKRAVDGVHTVLTAHVGDREHRFLYLSHRSSFSSLAVGKILDSPASMPVHTACLYTVALLTNGQCPPGARHNALVTPAPAAG